MRPQAGPSRPFGAAQAVVLLLAVAQAVKDEGDPPANALNEACVEASGSVAAVQSAVEDGEGIRGVA